MNKEKKIYMIDLFCGAGGVSEGAIQSNFHPIFSLDINKEVEKTYTNRHTQLGYIQNVNSYFIREDIRNITGEKIFKIINNLEYAKNNDIKFGNKKEHTNIDLIFGGPSCQGFSMLGKRDKEDPRNKLFGDYVRVISEVQPKYVVMENVVGFLSFEFDNFKSIDNTFYTKENTNNLFAPNILKEEFNKIGYNTLPIKVLKASDYGVPQDRERVIFIAYRKDQKKPKYPTRTIEKEISVKESIEDLQKEYTYTKSKKISDYAKTSIKGRTPTLFDKKPITQEKVLNNEKPNHTKIIEERFSLYNIGETTQQLRKRILINGIDISNKETLKQLFNKEEIIKLKNNPNEDLINKLLTKKNIRRRLDSDKPSKTVTTNPDDFISPFVDRTLTVREMARLQSFDDSFEFLGKRTTGGKLRQVEIPQYSQVGNAVPPLMAKAICNEIKKCLV